MPGSGLTLLLPARPTLPSAQAAIEAGELEEGESVDLRRAAWRYRALGLAFPGEALEALGEELKTLLGYCGRLDGQGAWRGLGGGMHTRRWHACLLHSQRSGCFGAHSCLHLSAAHWRCHTTGC